MDKIVDKDFRDNKSKKRIHALALTGDSLFTHLDRSWHALGSASVLRGSACQEGHRYHIGRVHFRINATPPLYAVSAPASLILDSLRTLGTSCNGYAPMNLPRFTGSDPLPEILQSHDYAAD